MPEVMTLAEATRPRKAGARYGRLAMDEAAFRAFYARTARPLRAYLTSALGWTADVDDLLQEAYMRLLRSGPVTDDEGYRRNYLYRIATNLVRDLFRRRRPETSVECDPRQTDHGDRVALRSDLREVLATLTTRDRELLWLAYAEGCSHAEIAAAQGLQAASIRSMLHRARQRLIAELEAKGLAPGTEVRR